MQLSGLLCGAKLLYSVKVPVQDVLVPVVLRRRAGKAEHGATAAATAAGRPA